MQKKLNLALACFLLGGIATVLPTLWKVIVFTGVGLVLFVTYDEWEYQQRIGGTK
ncbi:MULTISPECIES: hypothetical protein [Enterococcus]|nr:MULTISPECIES: hypothetical protein [Enterococcus]MDT2604698.1 hypothetical protein [Enterococcus dongliensis]MDT2760485.1 hypothetical protein [Enterococcus xiangfangensis]